MDLKIKVIPRSARSEMAGEMADGTLKVRIKAVPEDGKANRELCSFLAKHYKIAPDKVELLAGATSTRKLVRVHV
jgi:uncharacterized protein